MASRLAVLLASPPENPTSFRRVLGYSCAYGAALNAAAGSRVLTQGQERAYPLATALLSLDPGQPLQRTLGWLMLELHLGGKERLAEQISSWIRGLPKNGLSLTLGDVDGLRALTRKVGRHFAKLEHDQTLANHQTFQRVWLDELGREVAALMGGPSRADGDEEEPVPPSVGLVEPMSVPPVGDPAEPEDEPALVLEPWRGPAITGNLMQRKVRALAARELGARGVAELRRDPESILPTFIARELWERAASRCETAEAEGDYESFRSHVAHLLAIETGLSPQELGLLVFAPATGGVMFSVDVELGALRRPELRPPSAFAPGPDEEMWAEVGGDILLPLSTKLQALLRKLQEVQSGNAARHGGLLLPEASDPSRKIRESLAEVWPQGGITPVVYRRRLVAGLAASLGPDAAQIVFGETFGASAAPVYYAGYTSVGIADRIAHLNAPISGSRAEDVPRVLPDYRLGSRARPAGSPFGEAWELLGSKSRRSRGRPKASTLLSELRSERDSLALSFALCTGHRPTRQLAMLRIADLFPKAGMAVIRDKQTDPSRLTRLVATGKRFIEAVEAYLDSLIRIRHESTLKVAHGVIDRLLHSDLPLFTGIRDDGSSEPLDVAALFRGLPPPWSIRTNLHRHALNEALILAGVDPELRYFQMGWIATDCHAVSDFSPYPALSLGKELAPAIDSWLETIGWLGGNEGKGSGKIHMTVPLRSYGKAQQRHIAEHRKRHRELREGLRERRNAVLPGVIRRLADALETEEPRLAITTQASSGGISLVRASEDAELTITEDLVEAVLDAFKGSEPVEAHLGADLLNTLLRKAAKAGVCTVNYLPKLVRLTASGQPSPFVPGMGAAVTHAQVLRDRLVELAATLNDEAADRQGEVLAMVLLLAIASYTHFRSLEGALRILGKMSEATQSVSRPWVLRVPIGDGHASLGGVPAILQNRVSMTPGASTAIEALVARKGSGVGAFLKERLPDLCGNLSPRDAADWMFEALYIAASAELDGPERVLLDGAVEAATVTAHRAASADDGFSIQDCEIGRSETGHDLDGEVPVTHSVGRAVGRPRLETRIKLAHLMSGFNPDFVGDIGGAPANPPGTRRAQLRVLIKGELTSLAETPTVTRLILEFVMHLMGERTGRLGPGLALRTIYNKYNQISRMLRTIPPNLSMADFMEEELTAHLVMAVESESPAVRADLLAEVADFLRFASLRHGVVLPDWTSVQALAGGSRIRGSDPAVLTDEEAGRVISELFDNQENPLGTLRDPVEQRFRQAQLGAALIMEASGTRPSSIYGLTLADVHLSILGDYVHLKARGRYASVKTRTSLGFIPLEGTLWHKHREWFVGWYQSLSNAIDPSLWRETPLFDQPGASRGIRYPMSKITERITALVKWSTRDPAGRSYWFRKRRVQKRHASVRSQRQARARDVGRITRISGHAFMTTPIAAYLADPTTYLDLIGHADHAPTRTQLAAFAGVGANQLDQRWYRQTRLRNVQLTPELRLAAVVAVPRVNWQEPEWTLPPPYRPFVAALRHRSVAVVIPALSRLDQAPGERLRIAAELGLAEPVLEALNHAASTLRRRTDSNQPRKHWSLRPPRPSSAALAIESLLDRPDEELLSTLARRWVESALQVRGVRSCVFEDPSHADGLRGLLRGQGIGAEVRLTQGGLAVVVPMNGGVEMYGGAQALRWVLSVAWIAWYAEELLAGRTP